MDEAEAVFVVTEGGQTDLLSWMEALHARILIGDAFGAMALVERGLDEGRRQRQVFGDLREAVGSEPHVCDRCPECGRGEHVERCRFEAALRALLGMT